MCVWIVSDICRCFFTALFSVRPVVVFLFVVYGVSVSRRTAELITAAATKQIMPYDTTRFDRCDQHLSIYFIWQGILYTGGDRALLV